MTAFQPPKSGDEGQAEQNAASRARPQLGPTVLVIDDDDVGRALICETVAKDCRRVLQLSSPIGATQTASREHVDVVVLDVEMPNMSGDALARLFRSNPRLTHIGVILVSGRNTEQLVALGARCGADDVISKRHIRDSLPLIVRNVWVLSRNRARRAARGEPAAGSTAIAAASSLQMPRSSRSQNDDGKK